LRNRNQEFDREGLRLVLEAPRKTRRVPGLAQLMKRAQGVIDSGVPDLASNPEYFEDFGRADGYLERYGRSQVGDQS